jgi:hypothetical protein
MKNLNGLIVNILLVALSGTVGYALCGEFGWWGLLPTIPAAMFIGIGGRTFYGAMTD